MHTHSFCSRNLPILLKVVKIFIADFTDGVVGLNAKVVDVWPGLLVAVLANGVLGLVFVKEMLPELKKIKFERNHCS